MALVTQTFGCRLKKCIVMHGRGGDMLPVRPFREPGFATFTRAPPRPRCAHIVQVALSGEPLRGQDRVSGHDNYRIVRRGQEKAIVAVARCTLVIAYQIRRDQQQRSGCDLLR